MVIIGCGRAGRGYRRSRAHECGIDVFSTSLPIRDVERPVTTVTVTVLPIVTCFLVGLHSAKVWHSPPDEAPSTGLSRSVCEPWSAGIMQLYRVIFVLFALAIATADADPCLAEDYAESHCVWPFDCKSLCNWLMLTTRMRSLARRFRVLRAGQVQGGGPQVRSQASRVKAPLLHSHHFFSSVRVLWQRDLHDCRPQGEGKEGALGAYVHGADHEHNSCCRRRRLCAIRNGSCDTVATHTQRRARVHLGNGRDE